jgi:uncharacterized protein YhaN
VAALAERLALGLGGQPCERAAEELIRQFDQARVEGEKRKTLQTQRAGLARRAADACRRREELTHQLRQMCLEAGCQDVDGLPAIEQRAADAARLDARLGQLEEQLCELAVGAGLDALLAETEATDADALPGELDRLAGQIAELQQAQSQLAEQIGREKEALEAMQRDAGAVDAAEEVQDLLARLHGDCRQYARLRLAAAILRDGIETYRAKNEDPVLRRAGELFGRLTLGRFDRLLVETDEQGHGMLKGVRADGPAAVAGEPKTLDLAAMSEGTADQLFLALRLASIEHSLEGREPAPLVFDDILISFDDARAAAALEALADLSRRTQVLLFTHHSHLVELARQQLPPDVLFVHQLP